jgi:Protein of unknown function (DUF2934)
MSEHYRFDITTYDSARTYLKAALEHLIASGNDVRHLIEFAFEKFGGIFMPYLCRFLRDVHEGHININGLDESATMAFIGQHITAVEREAMIREAAYFRAEARGFSSCSPEDDWLSATQEVDERLARESGLVAEGRRALASAASGAEQELGRMKDVIAVWLEGHGRVTSEPAIRKAPGKKVVVRKKTVGGKSTRIRKEAKPAKKNTGKKTGTGVMKAGKTADRDTLKKKAGASKKTPVRKTIPARKKRRL